MNLLNFIKINNRLVKKYLEKGNSEELAQKIDSFFALSEEKRKEMSDNCRKIAVKEYSLEIQAKAYIELYQSILNH